MGALLLTLPRTFSGTGLEKVGGRGGGRGWRGRQGTVGIGLTWLGDLDDLRRMKHCFLNLSFIMEKAGWGLREQGLRRFPVAEAAGKACGQGRLLAGTLRPFSTWGFMLCLSAVFDVFKSQLAQCFSSCK